ncbi:MAG: hypothetical protein JXB32_24895 [Deltaproteobacteria bacterium]|nr:hypothetical protein [Deltaproteobacteria bacterium]
MNANTEKTDTEPDPLASLTPQQIEAASELILKVPPELLTMAAQACRDAADSLDAMVRIRDGRECLRMMLRVQSRMEVVAAAAEAMGGGS